MVEEQRENQPEKSHSNLIIVNGGVNCFHGHRLRSGSFMLVNNSSFLP